MIRRVDQSIAPRIIPSSTVEGSFNLRGAPSSLLEAQRTSGKSLPACPGAALQLGHRRLFMPLCVTIVALCDNVIGCASLGVEGAHDDARIDHAAQSRPP